jgi:EmrB/QacA subfamily drug resistance transporter
MAFIDETSVTVALPAVQDGLDATVVGAQWVVEAYTLLLAALILVGGSLGDHLGRRRMFASGVVLFALASVWCGLAPDPGQLIAARAVQGIGGALLVPNSLAIIGTSFAEERRGKAIGTWAGFTGLTMVLGPVLGGYLAQNFSWRGVFFINVPLAVAVLAITALHVPESRDAVARGLDLPGAALAAVGLGGTVFGLLESSREGFGGPVVAGSLAGGMAALVAFVLVEGRVGEPMVPLSLFRVRNFAGSNVFTLLLYFALSGTLFFLPFNLIQAQGYSATAAGAAVAPVVVIMFLLSRYTGNLADRFGSRVPLVTGSLVSAAGFVLFAVAGLGAPYWSTFFPAAVALGVGLAILVPALTTVALNSVEVRHSGLASAINNSFSQIAGLLAVAVLGVVMFAGFGASLDERLDDLHLPPEARRQLEDEKLALGAAEAPGGLDAGSRAAVDRAIDEALVSGYRVVMLVATAMALASAVGAALLVDGRKKPEEQPEESKPLAA